MYFHPSTLISVLHFGALYFWESGLNFVTQMIAHMLHDYWVFVDSLKSVADKKTFVLHERPYYKDFDVNESIQYNYYFFSYCIFISNFQFSRFNV